ncbi:unnamed protein product [Mesocestoides corti]|uniref:Histone-lysine N-methyltransferase SETMAR n=1 Tax=Mesocestoides corti TaxID=53468 RepID=A0A0R3U8R3_MESCO|nr:unnamed protein product [Mesocestoides corti]
MESKKRRLRFILLFYFIKGRKAAEAHKAICEVYGSDCITENTCQNWFKKFRSGDFSLKDKRRSGRPSEVDNQKIIDLIKSNRRITVREIAEKLSVSYTAIDNHLKYLGLFKRFGVWVLDELEDTLCSRKCEVFLPTRRIVLLIHTYKVETPSRSI